jgi:hypothetical protein
MHMAAMIGLGQPFLFQTQVQKTDYYRLMPQKGLLPDFESLVSSLEWWDRLALVFV